MSQSLEGALEQRGDSSVDISLRVFRDAWSTMVSGVPDGAVGGLAGTDMLFSKLPIPFFNVGFLMEAISSAQDLNERAECAAAWASPYGVPWFFVVTPERLAEGIDAAAALVQLGMVPLMDLTGMAADSLTPRAASADGLELRVAEDDESCSKVIEINSSAHGMDLAASVPSIGSAAFWGPHVPVIGAADGTAASCSTVIAMDDCHYVAFVATRPNFQRRGYGEAAVRHSLQLADARYGKKCTCLHATDAGKPVYERIGYKTVAIHSLFIESKFLGDH